jgi:hypothetical protein
VAGAVRSVPVTLGEGDGADEPTTDGDAQGTAGEGGVPGVQVTLLRPGLDGVVGSADDVTVSTTTTGAAGDYSFGRLSTDAYFIAFDLPAGFRRSPVGQGGDPGSDSDADLVSGHTAVFTLDPGEEDLTWDTGLYYGAGLGNMVWHDRDADGIQGAGEVGVPSVTVTLHDVKGLPIDSAVTDADGLYSFPHLPPGGYSVSFELPTGYQFSPAGRGGKPDADWWASPDCRAATLSRCPASVTTTATATPTPAPAGLSP